MTNGRPGTHSRDPHGHLFPTGWPWRAWFVFQDALLASVYEKSGDLWPVLRDEARHVTTWLQHLDYEDEIAADASLESAVALIPDWARVEARLEQARNLVGRDSWNGLTRKAAEAVRPAQR